MESIKWLTFWAAADFLEFCDELLVCFFFACCGAELFCDFAAVDRLGNNSLSRKQNQVMNLQ